MTAERTTTKTEKYDVCPVCGNRHNIEYHDIDFRERNGTEEWLQAMTCSVCKTKFNSVWHHTYQEVVLSFSEIQEQNRKDLLERLANNALLPKDLVLFSDMLSNAELLTPRDGFNIGIYALG